MAIVGSLQEKRRLKMADLAGTQNPSRRQFMKRKNIGG